MKQRKFTAAFLILLLLLGWAGYKLYLQQQSSHIFTGTVEATKADITPRIGGYLKELTIKEGDAVAMGQRIAQIDQRELQAQLVRDDAALAKAKAQLTDLHKGARPEELREAAANVASAASVYEKSHADYLRYQSLYVSGAISRQQIDDAKSADEVAANALAAAKERENLLRAGNRDDVIEAQQQEVKRAEAVLSGTKISLEDSILLSPLAGLVLTKNYEPGEYVSAGSAVATIADLGDCWVKIYVPSDLLGSLRAGQGTIVKIDAYPDRVFAGRIGEISDAAEYTPRQSITKNERANLVFAVKVILPNEEGIFKPGMVADVILE